MTPCSPQAAHVSTLKEAGHLPPLLVANAVCVEGRKGGFPQGVGQDSKAGDSFVLRQLSDHLWESSGLRDRSVTKRGI